jgi:vacuolar iron transporter family protein
MIATTHHHETHFTHNAVIRDLVIGMSDGLTVPFALAAGLSGAVNSTHIIVVAGLAEIAAGCIAMGLGGYMAAKSDIEHYRSELAREHREISEVPAIEEKEIQVLLGEYGIPAEATLPIIEALRANPDQWANFMMHFELGLSEPDPKRALNSALTIGGAYVLGGLIPLAPYMVVTEIHEALSFSIVATLTALVFFGYIKGRFMGIKPVKSALQTVVIGGIAAFTAYAIAQSFS